MNAGSVQTLLDNRGSDGQEIIIIITVIKIIKLMKTNDQDQGHVTGQDCTRVV